MTVKNPLLKILFSLRGNPRACVLTEPLWGLSMNLVLPYASVYMLNLGLTDAQVGLTATVYMLSQVIFGLMGGVITDKLGRRRTTALFDFISWCVPCVIWFFAQDFWFFLIAALVNGVMKVTTNSWDCLMVEDAEREDITGIYMLVTVAGQFSAIMSPISSLLVARLTLVPAVRILYLNAFTVMLIKLLLLYRFSRETKMGKIRMEAARGKNIFQMMRGYGGVIALIGKSRGTVFSLIIAAITGAVYMLNNTFWQVIASEGLGIPYISLPLFSMFKSFIALFFLFTVIPRITGTINLRFPLLTGFLVYLAGQLLLSLAPGVGTGGMGWTVAALLVSLVCDGFGMAILNMLAESLVALYVNKEERARVMAIQHMIIMLASAPFGYIGGLLSGISRRLPFALSCLMLLTGLVVTLIFYKKEDSSHTGTNTNNAV